MRKFLARGFPVVVCTAFCILTPLVAYASGIEASGRRIHGIVVDVGKWIIIVKGSIDCIQSVLAGDFNMAKRQFFGYLMCFGIMLALPWGMNEIEAIFR